MAARQCLRLAARCRRHTFASLPLDTVEQVLPIRQRPDLVPEEKLLSDGKGSVIRRRLALPEVFFA